MSHELSQIHETPARQLNSALGLLDKKSEEISELKAERSTLFERIAELELRLAAQSRPDRISQTPELETGDEITVDNGLADALRQLDEVQQERESLTAEVKLIKIARDDAEKNSQLFRELYGKASAFTDELRNENSTLSARAVLAERQASEGVALCRATYEARVRKLTDELKKATIRFNLIEAQAQRTDDDVRRRASLFFEQESDIDRLKKRIESLKDDCSSLKTQRDDLLVNLRTLEEERDSWTSERSTMDFEMRRMKIELARYAARERSVMQAWNMPDDDADAVTDGEPEDPGEEEVYVCQWVNDDGNWCGAALPSQQVR
jgi:chromosome segregation ATPase